MKKVWTADGETAGTKMSVGGRYSEANIEKVEVAPGHDNPQTWGTTLEAQTLRDGLFIARGVAPYDRSDNKFRVQLTDMTGHEFGWSVQVAGADCWANARAGGADRF